MSQKLPRDISHDRLVRFLLKRGCVQAREGAKHTWMKNPEGEYFAIPRHTALKTGLLNAVLKQAGVDRQDAIKNL
jgi:predicted RNA binding protein YcfA (HicA-like mRNA interferase family)